MRQVLFALFTIVFLACFTSHAYCQPQSLSAIEQLGKSIYFDKISNPDNMSCADCHATSVGFTGPNPGINKHGAVYRGAVPQRFGNRKPPSVAYVSYSPILHYDEVEEVWIGGNFWDGRATGWTLGSPIAEQALGPFLNPVEQNNASALAVLTQISTSDYAYLWELAFGEPLSLSPEDIADNYNNVGFAVEAYESSFEINAFSSKYDYYLAGEAELTPQEEWGLELFEGQGMCSGCHMYPYFTDFTFDNLGVPKNPENPFYNMDKVYLPGGFPINPEGAAWIDKGLGGFLQSAGYPEGIYSVAMGKQKVPTLRNVDLRPGNGFTKAYTHNGVFKSLKEVVHFYNTRDVESWPPPEVPENVNADELGNLGLSGAEEDAIVAFLKTLSDGYILPKTVPIAQTSQEISLHMMNPVLSTTQLGFYLPSPSEVSIGIFSMTGQKVATLAHGSYANGDHQVTLSPSQFKPGQYILYITACGQEVVKKVTIIR